MMGCAIDGGGQLERPRRDPAPWGVERSLSYARWAGVGVLVMQSLLFEPGPSARPYLIPATYALGGVLTLANLALIPALRRRSVSRRLAALMFSVDFGAILAIAWLYLDNPNATQWVLFLIIQLEAAYRWAMRGAVATAVGASLYYGVIRYAAAETFGFDFTIDSVTYVAGVTLVQGLVVGGMAQKLRSERDASLQLHEAALALNSALDRRAILDAVAREAARLSDAEIAILWVPDEGGFVPAAIHGLPPGAEEPTRLEATDPVFGESTVAAALATAEPVCRAAAKTGGRGSTVLEAVALPEVWRSVCSVPIHSDESPLGVLSCYLSDERPVDPEVLERLGSLGALAAVAIRNALAYQTERSALETLKGLDRLKDDFLSTVSHELRTPLTVVEGFATTLRNRWDDLTDEKRRDLVTRIEGQATGLHERIRDLLEFSRLQSGEYELNPEPFEAGPLISETVSRLEPALAPRPVEVDVPDGTRVYGDQMAFSQILENLLVNAARYSPPEAAISVRANEIDEGWTEVSVTDRGIGIPTDEMERIFERFYRGQSESVRKVRGTGVGLAIVKELTEAHGGRVRVESEPGRGSTFTVRFPALESSAPPDLTTGSIPLVDIPQTAVGPGS